jgi:hypothetical protein
MQAAPRCRDLAKTWYVKVEAVRGRGIDLLILGKRWGENDDAVRQRLGVSLQETKPARRAHRRGDGRPLSELL